MNKAKSKSKSMEEISRISSSSSNDLARAHMNRQSLPNQAQGKRRVIHPVIMDVSRIDEEDDDSVVIDFGQVTDGRKRSVRGSQMSKRSERSERSHRSRTESSSSRGRRESSASRYKRDATYDNRAYDNNLDGISVISRTSTRASSVQSLEVHREQYCCFTKWTPFERKLAALVVILATIIIILACTVAILARGD